MPNIIPPAFYRMLVVWLILALLATGCSPSRANTPQPADTPASVSVGEIPTATVADESLEPLNVEELEIRFIAEDYQPPVFATEPLGSISFDKDAAAAVAREIYPDDEAVELKVVDGAGLTWTLRIPAGAIMNPEMVRIVPLTQINASIRETAGEVAGGISLEPDGITFNLPVQLSVSGEGLQGPTLILAGTENGSAIDYTLQDITASDPTASIQHFSTYFASPLPDKVIVDAYKQARKQYDALAAEAKKLRRSPLEMPVPPSIDLECTDGKTTQKNNAAIEDFIKKAQNPELDLAVKMLAQWWIIAMTSADQVEGIPDLVQGMAIRNVRKANAMLDQYRHDETKLLAVSAFAMRSARQLALLGGDDAMIQEIISKVGSWNRSLIDDLVEDIHKNHNYRRIPTAMMVAYHAALLSQGDKSESFLEKLREALRFEARFTLTIANSELELTQTTEAIIPLQFEPAYGWVYRCYGEGRGKPKEATMLTDWGSYEIIAVRYPVKVALTDFDPCNGTVKIGIDRFGSEKDKIIYTPPNDPPTEASWTLFYDSGESIFSDKKPEGSIFYTFEVPVNNGKEEAVNTTITPDEHDNFRDTLEIRLIHK